MLLDLASGKTIFFGNCMFGSIHHNKGYMRNTFGPWVLSINCPKELATPFFVMGSVMGLFPFTKWVFLNDYYLLPMEKNPGYRNGVMGFVI